MTRRLLIPLAAVLALAACATRTPPPAPLPPVDAPLPPAPLPPPPPTTGVQPAGPVADLSAARREFAMQAATRYGVNPERVETVLARAQIREAIISAMSRPAEGKPWSAYRPIFLTPTRIDGGRAFLARERARFDAAEARYGVPREIIAAIMGVETGYGANMGNYPVVDALYTLAFRYPRTHQPQLVARENAREAFFRDELAQAFAMERDAGLDITRLKGSYAGAMGWGQFMPSSYRQYAVDGDGDGRRDLFTDLDDVIPSVANYFRERGKWRPGGPVMVAATRAPNAQLVNPDNRGEELFTLEELAARGYRPQGAVPAGTRATIVALDGVNGQQTWMVFANFHAIMRYNKSPLYATAVYQLAQALAGRPVPDP